MKNSFITFISVLSLTSSVAMAEDSEILPKQFVYNYNETTKVILHPDVCTMVDPTVGWAAEAINLENGDKAPGCWKYTGDGKTVTIFLEAGPHKYIDMQVYTSRFQPEY